MKLLTSLESCYSEFFMQSQSATKQTLKTLLSISLSSVFLYLQYIPRLFSRISLIRLDPCIAPSLHFHCQCMCVYVCVYGAPLHVGLLSPSHTSGAGSGTKHPEGPNFPWLPSPSLLCLFSPSVSHPRICQSGPGQSACCPPAIFHLLSHPLSYSFSSVHPFPSSLSLFPFSSPSLCISLSHIFSPRTLPAPLLSGLWQPL